jgi:uncharacterized protein (UPF0332 family)
MSSLWTLVDDSAAEARDLMRLGRYRGVISRSYYAVFTAARALLVEQAGFEEGDVRRHAAVHKLFSEHVVQRGLISSDLASGLRRLSTKRADADYHGPSVGEKEAAEALGFMEQFLEAAAQIRTASR